MLEPQNSIQGEWILWIQPTLFKSSVHKEEFGYSQIPPTVVTEWVDCSDPVYSRKSSDTAESHPRQWVDCSDPAYSRKSSDSRIPPTAVTAVGGVFDFYHSLKKL